MRNPHTIRIYITHQNLDSIFKYILRMLVIKSEIKRKNILVELKSKVTIEAQTGQKISNKNASLYEVPEIV